MSARWDRWCYLFFSILGCGLMGAAGYCYFAPAAEAGKPALDVAEFDVELTDCVPKQKREVVFRLNNGSPKPLRIIGLSGC